MTFERAVDLDLVVERLRDRLKIHSEERGESWQKHDKEEGGGGVRLNKVPQKIHSLVLVARNDWKHSGLSARGWRSSPT